MALDHEKDNDKGKFGHAFFAVGSRFRASDLPRSRAVRHATCHFLSFACLLIGWDHAAIKNKMCCCQFSSSGVNFIL